MDMGKNNEYWMHIILRRKIMKALKSVLLIVLLLSLLIVVGCQEGYTSNNYSTDNFTWERSANW